MVRTKSGQDKTDTEKHALGLAPEGLGAVIAAINLESGELSLHHASTPSEIVNLIMELNPLRVAVKISDVSLTGDIAALGVPILPVPPSTVKKHATGRGNANRDLIVATAARKWACVNSFIEADAAWLANIAAHNIT